MDCITENMLDKKQQVSYVIKSQLQFTANPEIIEKVD
jgi:hypothetical protein